MSAPIWRQRRLPSNIICRQRHMYWIFADKPTAWGEGAAPPTSPIAAPSLRPSCYPGYYLKPSTYYAPPAVRNWMYTVHFPLAKCIDIHHVILCTTSSLQLAVWLIGDVIPDVKPAYEFSSHLSMTIRWHAFAHLIMHEIFCYSIDAVLGNNNSLRNYCHLAFIFE